MTLAPVSTNLLDARGVTKRFAGITALSAVDLEVGYGEMVGLIGPTARGRPRSSTACSGCCGRRRAPSSFDGRDIGGYPVYKRARLGFGRTFQRLELFSGMTVREHFLVTERSRRGDGRLWKDLLNLSKPKPDELEPATRSLELLGLEAEADRARRVVEPRAGPAGRAGAGAHDAAEAAAARRAVVGPRRPRDRRPRRSGCGRCRRSTSSRCSSSSTTSRWCSASCRACTCSTSGR